MVCTYIMPSDVMASDRFLAVFAVATNCYTALVVSALRAALSTAHRPAVVAVRYPLSAWYYMYPYCRLFTLFSYESGM